MSADNAAASEPLQLAEVAGDLSAGFPDNLYNRRTGVYSVPVPSEELFQGVRAVHAQGHVGQGNTIAVIDTGLMLAHPWIAQRLVTSVDFTDEGPADQNGHGTSVAFALIYTAPAARLVNVKCFDHEGSGSRGALQRALRWCQGQGLRFINLSGGVHTPTCQGDCDVCQAALATGRSGPLIFAAAGNDPAKPLCPAKAAAQSSDIVAVGAYDTSQGRVAAYSAAGEIYGDVGGWQFRALL